MAARKSSNRAAFSLFAFQDIITSVTAIMVLLLLILALELVSRVANVGVSEEHRKAAQQLRASIAEIEAELEAKRAQVDAQRSLAAEAVQFSMEELEEGIGIARERTAALKRELRSLEASRRQAMVEQRRAEAELSQVASYDIDEVREQIEAMEERAAEIVAANERERQRQQEEQDTPAAPPEEVLVYNPPPDTNLEPILLEVGGQGVRATGEGYGGVREFKWAFLGGADGLPQWLRQVNGQRHYIVILLRPSGIEYYDYVRDAVVEEGLDVGTELIGEDVGVVVGQG